MTSRGRYKKNPFDRPPGFPDVIVLCRGKTIYLEFKTETGRVSLAQRETHKRLVACGGQVYVVRSLDEAMRAYREAFPGAHSQ